jgi:PKD repeat protein
MAAYRRWFSLLLIVVIGLTGVLAGMSPPAQAGPQAQNPNCKLLDDPQVRRLMSAMFEEALLEACGRLPAPRQILPAGRPLPAGVEQGGPDVRVNIEDPPDWSTIQSETSIALNRNNGTICVHYNDSYHYRVQGISYIGFANSTDGGQSFNDTPTNYLPIGGNGKARGDPTVVWRASDGYFYASSIHENISNGNYGLGFWRSTDDCTTFQWLALAHAGTSDDKEMLAVDNNPASPYYGRFYVAWMEFGAGRMSLIYSDNGTSWSAPVALSYNSVQGAWPAVAPNGDVYVAWLRYGSGDYISMEVARSTNGGASFTQVTNPRSNVIDPYDQQASNNCGRDALKANAGDGIRYLPSPQIAVGPDGCLHAVYPYDPDGHNTGDVINVYYRRSCDHGATWGPEVLLNDDGGLTDQFFPNVAVNEDNVVAASWYDRRLDPANNYLFDRYTAISTDGGVTWGPNERVSDASSPVFVQTNPFNCYHGDYDTLAADSTSIYQLWSDDRVFFNGHYDPDVYVERWPLQCDPVEGADFTWEPVTPTVGQTVTFTATAWDGGGGWVTETVDSAGQVGYYNSLALDADGYPHISYQDWDNGLRYAYYDGSQWISETLDNSGFMNFTSLALDSADLPHISYYYVWTGDLKYARYDGTDWNIEVVDEAGDVGYGTSLALDTMDQPHISYATNGGGLRYAYFTGTAWVTETVDASAVWLDYTSLALDSAGYPHISYGAGLWDLRYAYFDGTDWITEVVDISTGGTSSLALDGDDHPHISYLNMDALRYATYNGTSWITETVDSEQYKSPYTSLAVDAAGQPGITFGLNGTLRYARKEGGNWSIVLVDGQGSSASDNSLVLDASGQPHISYLAHLDDDLRYAWLDIAPPSPPLEYTWSLGDGTLATGQVVSHAYDLPGTYTVVLTASNCVTATATARHTVTVLPCEPVQWAEFTWTPPMPIAGQPATFTATATGTLPITYTWAWGDGSIVSGPSSIVTHTYTLPGPYTVILTATNCATATATAAHTLTVVPPCTPVQQADFAWTPPMPIAGQPATFTATATGTLPITYTWAWGDGSVVSGPSSVVSHTYALPGPYTVTLTATNCTSATATAVHTLTVVPQCDPVQDADFAWTPPMPIAGQPATFTATTTGTLPITYTWAFGDGSVVSGPSSVVSHTYALPGPYTVTLTATNCTTATATAVHTLTVVPQCDPVHDADFDWTPLTPTVGQEVTFTATATGTLPITYTWSFGDGSVVSGPSSVVTHSYALPGPYTVTLTATNCTSATATAVNTLTVLAPPPRWTIYLPLVVRG